VSPFDVFNPDEGSNPWAVLVFLPVVLIFLWDVARRTITKHTTKHYEPDFTPWVGSGKWNHAEQMFADNPWVEPSKPIEEGLDKKGDTD